MSSEGRIVSLSSGEIGSLWSAYIGETLLLCVMNSFVHYVQDAQVRKLLEMNLDKTENRVQAFRDLFKREGMKTPQGFGEQDVFLNSPRMFSDKFYMFYLKEMSRTSIIQYNNGLFASHRRDIREFMAENSREYTEVFHAAIELLLEKGIVIRTPSIPVPKEVHFIEDKKFLGKFKGNSRSVTAQEIREIYINLDANMLGKSLMIAFSQSAKSKELKEYLIRGRKMSHKHIDLFMNKLTDEDLPSPQLWDPEVSESTIAPFSDKLMFYHTGLATGIGVSNYGTALSQVARKDLSILFSSLTLEILDFSYDGVKMSIKNGWLEQPPLAANRDKLAGK
ncbi:DUF3231 family protein [Bacillus sp. FJAT-42376]|uniref:DUF3231 family protein n=1 Tax=Bacillus sp. FJAT-42376 TaxID=2014076 RepID=UPI000F4F0F14|nr:DUF3231 family protein [Bacillus sp. FJAT-42376]AZB40986.1 DUF3231 family protein [Bacillus sp. FJAT-42376]